MDQNSYSIKEFRGYLVSEGLAKSENFTGCTEEEIQHLMDVQQVEKIPKLYYDFLILMGKRPYPLMVGTDWSYKHLLEIKEWSIELIQEEGEDPSLLDDALVIAMHQGYMMYYIPFISMVSEDPPVWVYVEKEAPKMIALTFREFLLQVVDMERHWLKRKLTTVERLTLNVKNEEQ
jgi:hypothetical protein